MSDDHDLYIYTVYSQHNKNMAEPYKSNNYKVVFGMFFLKIHYQTGYDGTCLSLQYYVCVGVISYRTVHDR